ncbi:MAG TPA: response regulator [Ktedonobacteraceae bacterium]|nr:response regulator [Ktedonobacteraceae bacterium]
MSKQILIADDDSGITEAVKLMLEDEGYSVDTVSSSAEIKNMSQELPAVLVLDIWITGEDGCDICKYLKSQETTSQLPIILFSANKDIRRIAQEAGADDFLPKPFDIDELLQKVQRFID